MGCISFSKQLEAIVIFLEDLQHFLHVLRRVLNIFAMQSRCIVARVIVVQS